MPKRFSRPWCLTLIEQYRGLEPFCAVFLSPELKARKGFADKILSKAPLDVQPTWNLQRAAGALEPVVKHLRVRGRGRKGNVLTDLNYELVTKMDVILERERQRRGASLENEVKRRGLRKAAYYVADELTRAGYNLTVATALRRYVYWKPRLELMLLEA